MAAFRDELLRFNNGESPDDLREELEKETGIWMVMTGDSIEYLRRRKM